MSETSSHNLEMRGNLSGLLTIIMWSASGLLLALTNGIPAFELALFTLPFPFIVTAFRWWKNKEDWRKHFRHPWYVYAIGTCGLGGYTILWYLGFKNAPVFQANLLNYMWPFLILVFSAILLKQKMTWMQILGTLLAFSGLLLLFTEKGGVGLSEGINFKSEYLWGYLSALAGAVVWGLYSVLVRKVAGFGNDVIAICCLLAGIPILIAHLALETFVMPSSNLMWIGLIGLLLTRVSYLFWNFAMKNGRIETVVSISYFTPIFSSVLLIVFQYAQNVGTSALLILCGCLIISWNYITSAIKPEFDIPQKA